MPPLSWWLRDSVARASFLLSAAYLLRDRDVKLRVYPGLAPMLVMPVIFLVQDQGRGGGSSGGFSLAFAGVYLGLIPMLGLELLRYSQQWQAADLFRIAPMPGPAQLCHGARRAVLLLLTLPLLLLLGLTAWLLPNDVSRLWLLLPGMVALPVFALLPCLSGNAVPLSRATEEAKSAGRGLTMIGATIISAMLAGVAAWSWTGGWFKGFLLVETFIAVSLYLGMRASMTGLRWRPEE